MKTQKTSLHKKRLQGVAKIQPRNTSEILEEFLDYARYELNFSPQTIIKYRDALKSFLRDLRDKPIEEYEVQEFVQLKKQMAERGLSEARVYSVVYAVRSLLSYCQNFLGLNVLNPKQIRPPKRSKREVV